MINSLWQLNCLLTYHHRRYLVVAFFRFVMAHQFVTVDASQRHLHVSPGGSIEIFVIRSLDHLFVRIVKHFELGPCTPVYLTGPTFPTDLARPKIEHFWRGRQNLLLPVRQGLRWNDQAFFASRN